MSYRAEKLKNGVTFDFEVKFDLEGQSQSPPKTIGILTKVFYTYGPNLVILAGLGSIPFFQFNSNSFTFNSNSFGMKNSNSNSNSFLSIPIPIPFYQFLFDSFLKPN